jgi:hypothetical protein
VIGCQPDKHGTRHALICFEHHRGVTRESVPLCLELDIDVRVPWSWVETTIGEVRVDAPANNPTDAAVLTFEATITKIEALACLYQAACPACKEPLHYVAWSIEDFDEDAPKDEDDAP